MLNNHVFAGYIKKECVNSNITVLNWFQITVSYVKITGPNEQEIHNTCIISIC